MKREQNRLFLTLVANSWIQRELTHQSPHIQSHGSTLILSWSTQCLCKSHNVNKSVGRNKVIYFL